MPRMSRRDRKIRAAFKRMIQPYLPDPAPLPEWDADGNYIDPEDFEEEAELEHA